MRTYKRVHDHINGPARDDTGQAHVFLPQWRMREIRREEDVIRARAKREGRGDLVDMQHFDCHCGSISCVRSAIDRGPMRGQRAEFYRNKQ